MVWRNSVHGIKFETKDMIFPKFQDLEDKFWVMLTPNNQIIIIEELLYYAYQIYMHQFPNIVIPYTK